MSVLIVCYCCIVRDCVSVVNCLLFFFFKQKTAYEMRISDWSSDVCSSDLIPAQVPTHGGESVEPEQGRPFAEPRGLRRHARGDRPPRRDALRGEIGRVSCRERVCQYV